MKLLPVLLAIMLPVFAAAQNVAINNDNSPPDATAILDIKSSSKGILIPRLTTAQRDAIVGPPIGLTIYNTETNSFWYYASDVGGGWLEMLTHLQKYWSFSAGNIYNTNSGNIGIGTNSPTEKLSLNATDPAIQFLNAGSPKGFIQAAGNDMRIGTYFNNTTGDLYLNTRATDRMIVTNTGLIGIGTNAPTTALTINATNPTIQLRNADVNKGFLQVSGDDLRLSTYLANATGRLILGTRNSDRLLIDEAGQVGIGTTNPTTVLTINGANPTIQLRNAETDRGFVQLMNDDIKIGTNIGNADGRFIVRLNGSDRVFVDEDGHIGIGGTPTSHLMINSNIANDYPFMEMKNNNITYGRLEIVQNAQLDIQLTAATPTGRAIIRGNANPFGVVVHPNTGVSIGSTIRATGYALSVNGFVMCEDLTILDSGSWPDYVFSDDYRLLKLDELRTYIDKHKHLPGIPSATEIEKDGIQLRKISKGLMEKVEELTLYIFQLQDQINELKKKK